jgi:ankyrin repeat protein
VLLPEKYLGLRSVTDKLSKEEIVDIFSVKNRVGDTPLHTADSFPEDLVQYLLELDIGALWTMPNANSQTPLSLILLEGKASPAIFNMILSSVSVIPPGLVSLLFTNAAQGPELQTIQLLAERGADFNESVDDCPAIIRLRMISAPILRELAKCGVEFNVANSDNNTILFRALESKHPVDSCEVLEMLVKEFNLNVNHVNSSGITPLICALQYRRPKAEVAKLLEWGADVNHCSEKAGAFMSVQNYRGVHKLEIIELLLKAGADPNMKFYNKKRTQVVLPIVTLLNSTYEVRELMELFVQYGANLNMRDDTGNTLLHLLENDTQIDYLLKFIDVHETNIFGQTALWNMKLSLPAVQIILKVDPNLVNHVANDGSTVLHLHQENPTQLLLLKLDNIDLSVVNKLGQSFMHTRGNGPQVFQPLADAYARQSEESKLRIRRAFNHVDAFGRTVLHYVCEHDLSFAQKMIETFELDVHPNSQSLNLQIGWSSDVIKYLLSKGSNPNAQSVAGYTFLHFICGNPAKAKLIRTMLKYGASIDIKNSSGISPADLDPNLKTGYQFATWSSSQKEKLFTAKKKKPEYDSDSDSDDFRLLKKLKG